MGSREQSHVCTDLEERGLGVHLPSPPYCEYVLLSILCQRAFDVKLQGSELDVLLMFSRPFGTQGSGGQGGS